MKEIYEIDEKTRIRRCDSMNYVVKTLQNAEKRDGTLELRWDGARGRGFGPFFGNLASAARRIAENKACEAKTGNLKAFLREYERIGAEIAGKIVGKG